MVTESEAAAVSVAVFGDLNYWRTRLLYIWFVEVPSWLESRSTGLMLLMD